MTQYALCVRVCFALTKGFEKINVSQSKTNDPKRIEMQNKKKFLRMFYSYEPSGDAKPYLLHVNSRNSRSVHVTFTISPNLLSLEGYQNVEIYIHT